MKQSFILKSESGDISLRTIVAADNENLISWKNQNRFSFFFQGIISSQMQEKWLEGYLERPDDHMFIILHHYEPIGCMGYRLKEGLNDIYNVILGDPDAGGKGYMSIALGMMCSYIITSSPHEIGLKVLRTNPAVKWYLKNGFYKIADQDTFLDLRLDLKRFKPVKITSRAYHVENLSGEEKTE